MRDPLLDKNALASHATGEGTISGFETTSGDTPAALSGLDDEIEALAELAGGPKGEQSPFGQYVKDCPVCKSAVRCFFVNFNEKVVMCENTTCSWPFGYEELECLKHDEALSVDDEVESLKVLSHGPVLPTGSIISTQAWSELERSNKGLDSEEPGSTPTHQSEAARDAKLQEVLKQKEADLQTKKNLQDIKKLNVQLQQTYEEEDTISCIRNEKWIKHLNNLQSISGMKLLRKEEMALLKEDKAPLGLTMNIDSENTSITINLAPLNSIEPTTEQNARQEETITESTPTESNKTITESMATGSTATEITSTELKELPVTIEPVRTEDEVVP